MKFKKELTKIRFIRGVLTCSLFSIVQNVQVIMQSAAEKQNKCIDGCIFTVTHFCLKGYLQGTVNNTFTILMKSFVICVICSETLSASQDADCVCSSLVTFPVN